MSRLVLRSLLVVFLGAVVFGVRFGARASVYYSTQDGSHAKDFAIVKSGDLWYWIGIHAFDGAGPPGPASDGLILAQSRELARWQDIGVAIPVGSPGAWDSYDIWAPSIVKVGETYHIFYAGVQYASNQVIQKIGHATSTNLVDWTKDPNPVFDCSTLSWTYWNLSDTGGAGTDCRDPYVIWDAAGSQWVMFFTARSQTINQDPVQFITNPAIIGMATSTDLINWVDGGRVITTAGYTAESPHVFEHNGTWSMVWTNNCSWRSAKCLKIATAPALTGPYTGYDDLPVVPWYDFASEYFTDGTTEYFGRASGFSIAFDKVAWNGNVFGLTDIPYGTIIGSVWFDRDRDGLIDPGEPGIDGVRFIAYRDDGDGVFDTTTDSFIGSSTSFYNATLTPLKHGTYRFQTIAAGSQIWIQPLASNFNTVLADYVSSTGDLLSQKSVPSTTVFTGKSYGFQFADMTSPAAVTDLR